MSLGKPGYEVVAGWEQLPAGWVHRDAAAVAVDSRDRVYVVTRMDRRIIVYEADGRFAGTWGDEAPLPRVHCLRFGPDGSVYTVDEGDHSVRKFSPEGRLLMTLGNPGVPSDTGYNPKLGSGYERQASVAHGGPPFHRPTGVSLAPSGEMYVSDGYGNARIHRFSPEGELIQSWGEPGTGPGEFNLPHDLWVTQDGRVMVADRENDRIQFFSLTGQFLDQWTHVQRPTGIFVDQEGLIYVSENSWHEGQRSFRNGLIEKDLPGHVAVLAPDGTVLARLGEAGDPCAPGNFCAPHGLCLDSRGDLYVVEVAYTHSGRQGLVPEDCHVLQKFARRG